MLLHHPRPLHVADLGIIHVAGMLQDLEAADCFRLVDSRRIIYREPRQRRRACCTLKALCVGREGSPIRRRDPSSRASADGAGWPASTRIARSTASTSMSSLGRNAAPIVANLVLAEHTWPSFSLGLGGADVRARSPHRVQPLDEFRVPVGRRFFERRCTPASRMRPHRSIRECASIPPASTTLLQRCTSKLASPRSVLAARGGDIGVVLLGMRSTVVGRRFATRYPHPSVRWQQHRSRSRRPCAWAAGPVGGGRVIRPLQCARRPRRVRLQLYNCTWGGGKKPSSLCSLGLNPSQSFAFPYHHVLNRRCDLHRVMVMYRRQVLRPGPTGRGSGQTCKRHTRSRSPPSWWPIRT